MFKVMTLNKVLYDKNFMGGNYVFYFYFCCAFFELKTNKY